MARRPQQRDKLPCAALSRRAPLGLVLLCAIFWVFLLNSWGNEAVFRKISLFFFPLLEKGDRGTPGLIDRLSALPDEAMQRKASSDLASWGVQKGSPINGGQSWIVNKNTLKGGVLLEFGWGRKWLLTCLFCKIWIRLIPVWRFPTGPSRCFSTRANAHQLPWVTEMGHLALANSPQSTCRSQLALAN